MSQQRLKISLVCKLIWANIYALTSRAFLSVISKDVPARCIRDDINMASGYAGALIIEYRCEL